MDYNKTIKLFGITVLTIAKRSNATDERRTGIIKESNETPRPEPCHNHGLISEKAEKKKKVGVKDEIKTGNCINCGEKFEKLSNRQIYCSKKCKQAYKINKDIAEKRYGEAKCPVCGKHFVRTYKKQSYCSRKCSSKSVIERKKKEKATGNKPHTVKVVSWAKESQTNNKGINELKPDEDYISGKIMQR